MTDRISAAEFRAQQQIDRPRRSKYGAVAAYRCRGCDSEVTKGQERCRVCGGTERRFFASRAEAKRYDVLRAMERRSEIFGLQCQPVFPLVINGVSVGVYKADFRYIDPAGDHVVEDVKSEATMTEAATLRMKVAEAIHEIRIRKVYSGRSGNV